MNTTTIPAGFRIDAKGRLIPESTIKPLDLIRDALVQQLVDQAKPLRAQLVDYREKAFTEIDALVELAAQDYNATLGGEKGNVTLYSFDGRYKVIRARAEKISFDERLQAAKALIDECLRDWSQGARPEIATLVQDAFKVDQAGNIRTGTVLGLRRIQIADERWQNAMLAIGDAVQVVDSKSYLRLYERDAKGDYQPISLDIAAVKS
jgi:hypothetical protein